jgi:hypothetical protein
MTQCSVVYDFATSSSWFLLFCPVDRHTSVSLQGFPGRFSKDELVDSTPQSNAFNGQLIQTRQLPYNIGNQMSEPG